MTSSRSSDRRLRRSWRGTIVGAALAVFTVTIAGPAFGQDGGPKADQPDERAEAALQATLALASDAPGFAVVAIRPHLVWGPGDTQLTERIIARAHAGRLPLLGSGAALIDTIYVDNAAAAIIAGLDRADVVHGNAYVVTNGEPRPIAEVLAQMCRAGGVTPPRWRIPAALARTAGGLIEAGWRVRPGEDEPPMTRFLAEQLSTAHWFDQRRTRADLEWAPHVSLREGFDLLAAHYVARA